MPFPSRHRWFGAATFAAMLLTLLFLVTPLVAILTNTDPRSVFDSLGEPANREALLLSLETTTAAMLIVVAVGTPAAYWLAMSSFRGRSMDCILRSAVATCSPQALLHRRAGTANARGDLPVAVTLGL